MNAWLEELAADARRRWLVLLQWLNGVAITLGGLIVAAQAFYPGAGAALVGWMPPAFQAVALLAFGALVHYASRQAKKDLPQ